MTICPAQIVLAGGFVVKHSATPNCVVVEGRVVALRLIVAGEQLTVNLSLFVYDMVALFPTAFHDDAKGFKYLDEEVKQRLLYLCEPPVRAQAMADGFVVRSTNGSLIVRPNGDMGQTAYAAKNIPKDTVLFHAKGLVVSYPTMYTICVGAGKHLLFGDAAECLAHCCSPNVRVEVNGDQKSFNMITVRDISEGELVTFCYCTTEWDMNSPFPCLCGAPSCFHMIRGFKHLSDQDRQSLWPITSSYIKSLC